MATGKDGSILPIFREAKEGKRKIAIAIDGGGILGTMVAKALAMLEEKLVENKIVKEKDGRLRDVVRLFVGTSTGSILASALAMGQRSADIHTLYVRNGQAIFTPKDLGFWGNIKAGLAGILSKDLDKKSYTALQNPPIYKNTELEGLLKAHFGQRQMKSLWNTTPQIDLVIVAMDLKNYKSRFIKPYNRPPKFDPDDYDFTEWPVNTAVLASCAVPIYFPSVPWAKGYPDHKEDSDFVDGGVGAYSNPSFIAAYEICKILSDREEWESLVDPKVPKPKEWWNPATTTLISIGTGLTVSDVTKSHGSDNFGFKEWMSVTMNSFSQSTSHQQNKMIKDFFTSEEAKSDPKKPRLDFHRFNIDFKTDNNGKNIELDDVSEPTLGKLDEKDNPIVVGTLTTLGEKLGKKILSDDKEKDKDL